MTYERTIDYVRWHTQRDYKTDKPIEATDRQIVGVLLTWHHFAALEEFLRGTDLAENS